ncbi:MAG: hypothetical protein KR126chlam1_00843 [Chlamydiae bacterium]|nr:hypothetical protein [Chlamydiota bacterium]
MKKLLFLFLILNNIALFGSDPTFVRINETYCAGASEVAREIEQLDDSWVYIDEDALYQKRLLGMIAGRFPSEYQAITLAINYHYRCLAIKWNVFSFRDYISKRDQEEARNGVKRIQEVLDSPQGIYFKVDLRTKVRSDLLAAIREASQERKNIIIGATIPFPQPPENELENYQTLNVLVFQSFSNAIVSFEEKKQEALEEENEGEKPFLTEFLLSFDDLFCLSGTRTERTIAEIERREVQEFFQYARTFVDQTWDEKSHLAFSGQQMNLTSLFRIRRDFLTDSHTSRPEKISYLEPKKDYDLILYADEKSPESLAHSILNIVTRSPPTPYSP